jgi:putative oxidoreductase
MGSEKLKNINEASEFFTSLGFSHPIFHSYLTGYIELIGGLLLIIGFASRLAAIPLMFATLTILTAAHTPAISEWKFFTHPSLIAHQSPYPFLITTLLILIFGPGLFSIDGWVKRWLHKRNHHYPS